MSEAHLSRGRRVPDLVAGSAFAAMLASLAIGAAEALTSDLASSLILGAIGFTAMLAAPIGFTVLCLARLLWRAWRPAEVAAAALDPDTGGAPRLAAWAVFAALAAYALAALTLQTMILVVQATGSVVVHVLAAPVAAVTFACLLAALSRPSVDGLARLAASLDRRLHHRLGRSIVTPRWVVALALSLALLFAIVGYVTGIRPHIGHLDLGFAPSLGLGVVLLAAGPAAWAALRRRRAVALLLVVALAAALGSALWLRHGRPFEMLAIWGRSQISGLAIDWLFGVQELRGELDLGSVRPAARAGAAPRDIVLVTIDTVRADRTPIHSGTANMPALTRLAGQGAVFQWAFSPGNVTRRSLPSMMLGVSAPRVSGRVAGWALQLDPRHVLLAERLRAAGHDTAGFFCCASQFGAEHQLGLIRGIAHVVIERDGERLAAAAARWLAAREAGGSARPLFLWLHFIEPHDWASDPPAARDASGRDRRYELALADADRALGHVVEAAWSPARRARTYFLVTSDHGEGLGDHGHQNHAASLYNSEIRVPLVVAGPGIQPRRIARPVGLSDLAPTIIDLAGFAPPGMPAMDGVSLGPLLRGEPARGDGEAYAAMIADRSVASSARALIVGQHKLVWNQAGTVELYDLAVDAGERRNLAGRRPEVQAALAARLAALREIERLSPF